MKFANIHKKTVTVNLFVWIFFLIKSIIQCRWVGSRWIRPILTVAADELLLTMHHTSSIDSILKVKIFICRVKAHWCFLICASGCVNVLKTLFYPSNDISLWNPSVASEAQKRWIGWWRFWTMYIWTQPKALILK